MSSPATLLLQGCIFILHAPQCYLDERCQDQDAVPEKPPYKGVPHTVEMVVEMITMENAGLQCDDNNMAKEGQT